MKKLILLAVLVLAGCESKPTPTDKPAAQALTPNATPTTPAPAMPSPETLANDQNDLTGSWTGMFGPNKITIVVDQASEGVLAGRSIVAGNDRPFKGTFAKVADEYQFEGKEPGDNPYDGTFKFKLDPDSPDKISGTWTPFKQGVASKKYELKRRVFAYQPKSGDYAFVSLRLLKESDVENLPPDELRIMRNEIYARHGYNFKNKDMRSYFDNQAWYMPWNTDVRGLLTAVEKKNESLLKRYEKYNADYYDDFGR